MEKRIFLSSPTMHGEEMKFIQEAFDKNWVAPLGFNCDGFEAEMCHYLCVQGETEKYALALSSGTSAEYFTYGTSEGVYGRFYDSTESCNRSGCQCRSWSL